MTSLSVRLRLARRVGAAAIATVALFVAAAPASAKTKLHKDEVRGFECRVDTKFEQVPPKPGSDDAHIAAFWHDRSPSFRARGQPKFRIIWAVTPKGDATEGKQHDLPEAAKDLPPARQAALRAMLSGTKESLQGDVDGLMRRNVRLFGPYTSFEERLAEQKKPKFVKTKSGQKLRILEVNFHRKIPKDTSATWWLWLAFTQFETETETIDLGFYGYVDLKDAKEFRKKFEATVKSFKLRAFDAREAEAGGRFVVENPEHPEEKKIAQFIKEKVIKGWSTIRTPHYLIVYDDDVNKKKIVNRVVREIEALRSQLYEVMFPPDRPIEAISIVRICETREQYRAYGAPAGSGGYWSSYHEELVLFQDKGNKKGAIETAYHEAFHQYIYYSVGNVAPHSWFNEGHGDFFSGHIYKGGKFKRGPDLGRIGSAKDGKQLWKDGWERKRNVPKGATGPEMLHLREWLTWRKRQYYGRNDWNVSIRTNYALGWSFIYFLRTTRNEEYQRILPRYFDTLKSFVTQARDAREAADSALKSGLSGGDPEGGGDGDGDEGEGEGEGEGEATAPTPPDEGGTTDTVSRSEWHGESLKTALQGIDLDQLQKDWLDHNW